MWRSIKPLSSPQLRDFETTFHFTINSPLREFLLEHNGGIPSPGIFPTRGRNRKIARFLNFADQSSAIEAWAINKRLRDQIGPKRIIIGIDALDNFICLERNYKQQYIVLWNHLNREFEESLWDIPAFLRGIG